MPQMKDNAFTFTSKALPEDAFTVVRFSGEEGLSMLYRFEILLISERDDIDLTAVLQHPATFTIKGHFSNGQDLPFHGILAGFEQMHQAGPYIFYRAELRPRLWWLTLTHHNQVFLDKKIDQVLAAVLTDGGLAKGVDFDLRFQGAYQPWEYLCQYGESHFGFLSRWMEREGMYYWFEQGADLEKMIASDTLIAHAPLAGYETFHYSPPSGLDAADAGSVIKRFTLKQSPMPKNVLLKDYNYMKPSLDLEGKAPVRDQGRGEIYIYGEHFKDTSEGTRLATIRAGEYRCREKIFQGLSSIPAIRPGYLFTLDRHYSNDFNDQYLTIAVHHEGSQERYLISGLGVQDLEDREGLFYRNTFQSIPYSTQFRPARTTPKPRISGTISAKIDAAGSGQYAELDEHGRYKVIMPFDQSGRSGGKASAWLRMATPYAGADHGMHFPLHKGTEVLLTFTDGDPDRPMIASAATNPETPSPVTDSNQAMANITTGGGNKIHISDEAGNERILLHSPGANTFMRLGAPNDPPAAGDAWTWEEAKDKGFFLNTEGPFEVHVGGFKLELVLGGLINSIAGVANRFEFTGGADESIIMGGKVDVHVPQKWKLTNDDTEASISRLSAAATRIDATAAVHTRLDEMRTDVTQMQTTVGQTNTSLGQLRTDLQQARTDLHSEVVEAKAQVLQATGTKMTAISTALKSVSTTLSTTGVQLDEAGTVIENNGSKISTAGTHIKNAGSSIASSSIAIRDAAAILDA